jgi:hypothetical protein
MDGQVKKGSAGAGPFLFHYNSCAPFLSLSGMHCLQPGTARSLIHQSNNTTKSVLMKKIILITATLLCLVLCDWSSVIQLVSDRYSIVADHYYSAIFAFSQALRQLSYNPADVYVGYFTDINMQ